MARLMQYVSEAPMELDITPSWFSPSKILNHGATAICRLHKVLDYNTDSGPPTPTWLLAQSTGVRFDAQKPHLRLYFMRAVGDTDEQIETARKALVSALESDGDAGVASG
jgi:hypothetical protein